GAESAQLDHRARLGARGDAEVLGAVEGLERDRRAQGGRGHRHGHGGAQVVAIALEDVVAGGPALDEGGSGRAGAGAGFALARAAAVIGTDTEARRWSPSRWKTSWRVTMTSTKRSPAGPPPGPTSPWLDSWIRVPSETPAGMRIFIVRCLRTRPSPWQLRQGLGMTVPKP